MNDGKKVCPGSGEPPTSRRYPSSRMGQCSRCPRSLTLTWKPPERRLLVVRRHYVRPEHITPHCAPPSAPEGTP
jgi:hypothetical protein